MLVLTRKETEIITIGDEIKVFVLRIDEESVRLGIAAPRKIAVHRQEVYEKILNQKIMARYSDTQNINNFKFYLKR